MFGISGAGYDMSTSIFSPDGRIFAAEYAKKAVEQGATSIGVLAKNGVVLLAEKKLLPLQEPDSIEKISQIDTHIGVATSGLMADARKLIQDARVKAQSFWLTYEEPIPGEALAEYICDIKAQFTQRGGARPYGVAMIFGSIDYEGIPRLYVTDPVGTSFGFLAAVIGRGTPRAGEYLEKHYKKNLLLDKAIALAVEALRSASGDEIAPESVEIARIPVKTATFERLSREEIESFLATGKPPANNT
ncbi:MAG: archaeal proteasome endopeptidase complex subunit alpha [Candidatus Thorarchaeota archaeon]|nr:archaeal proteasome endopeptidase complex subunit alpha [Candidatus Thorarchaeota archaeon]